MVPHPWFGSTCRTRFKGGKGSRALPGAVVHLDGWSVSGGRRLSLGARVAPVGLTPLGSSRPASSSRCPPLPRPPRRPFLAPSPVFLLLLLLSLRSRSCRAVGLEAPSCRTRGSFNGALGIRRGRPSGSPVTASRRRSDFILLVLSTRRAGRRLPAPRADCRGARRSLVTATSTQPRLFKLILYSFSPRARRGSDGGGVAEARRLRRPNLT